MEWFLFISLILSSVASVLFIAYFVAWQKSVRRFKKHTKVKDNGKARNEEQCSN